MQTTMQEIYIPQLTLLFLSLFTRTATRRLAWDILSQLLDRFKSLIILASSIPNPGLGATRDLQTWLRPFFKCRSSTLAVRRLRALSIIRM